ncbi:GerAB/ArcD/ProY family transporter [Paenibacillus thermotolerans]|uniref:GerAB/ArcD/ProY family transporter n=1 Tax=Paenibacillus thermotolerans TaxID=3027807 RepID=UPI00236840CF|nr:MULTISPECIES: endospore germination permease [unclassified Paenibacillus]
MNNSSISFVQLVMIMMLSTGLMNHVIIIPILVDTAKRDAWISVLAAGGLAFVWIGLLYLAIAKMVKQHVFQWITRTYHPVAGHILAIIACIYMLVLCGITTRDTVTWIRLTFSPQTPNVIIAIILVIVCAANAYMGLRSLANTAGILLPFVVLLGFFVMLANVPHKNYTLLRPFLEHGMQPVWDGAVYAGAGFVEVIMILFVYHRIRSKISFASLMLLMFILIGLTLGPLMGAIIEFGPDQAAKLRYPAYEEWRLVIIGQYIEHVDFFSIYQWFCGAFLRISLTMYLILEIFRWNGKFKVWALAFITSAMVYLSVMPVSDPLFLDALAHYVLPWIVWTMIGYSLVIVILIYVPHLRRDAKS